MSEGQKVRVIKPRYGFATIGDVRRVFEGMMTGTPTFAQSVELTPLENQGVFEGYKNPETHHLWIGFSLGIRCCEKLAHAGVPVNAQSFNKLNIVDEKPGDKQEDREGEYDR